MPNNRNARGRDVNGVLVLDKPAGISSNDAVQRAKRLFFAKKVGHTGSLDPLATGVLPLCFGQATKFSQYLLTADKKYSVTALLGVATDSGDADGKVIKTERTEDVDATQLEHALAPYRGEIKQVPSMFSAIKHKGQPLYKLARQGVVVEREARPIHVYSIELTSFSSPVFTIDVHCSKGTYVRTLVADIGEDLGCGAHVTDLRRTLVGPFEDSQCVTFDELEDARQRRETDQFLQPVSSAVGQWPTIALTAVSAYHLRHGQPVFVPHAPSDGWVKLCEGEDPVDSKFLGIGEILDDGRVAPRRLIH